MMANRKATYVWLRAGLLLLILCGAALTVSAFSRYAAEEPLIIAHRGASGFAPENTMAAFELAERLGTDFIEFDVRMSKDGELVIIHDETVDRTTNFTGNVKDYTLRELQGMDAAIHFHPLYAEQPIVTLSEVMNRFAGKIGMLIEIKDPRAYPGIEEKVAEVVRRYELLQDMEGTKDSAGTEGSAGIIIQSFDFESARKIHNLLPDISVGVLIHAGQHPLSGETLDKLASYASYINYSHDLLDKEIVREIHDRNRKVMAWTIRKERDMERMKKLGVDGIITDYPDF